jgi:hypothetical protein
MGNFGYWLVSGMVIHFQFVSYLCNSVSLRIQSGSGRSEELSGLCCIAIYTVQYSNPRGTTWKWNGGGDKEK